MKEQRDRKRGRKAISVAISSELNERFRRELETFITSSVPTLGFAADYLLSEVYSKYTDLSSASAEARRQAAIDKWLLMERRNESTNLRLFYDDATICGINTEAILRFAAKVIQGIIGDSPPEDLFLKETFTNGASTRVSRSVFGSAMKFEGKAHITESALKHWYPVAEKLTLWKNLNPSVGSPTVVRGSVLFTVPKNSDIDRVACKEPEINMILQRSVGIHFRDCLLKNAGINLRDQEVNQRLAKEGSLTGSLATLDLSSASDLISRTLVNRLLPPGWYVLLDDLRVHHTMVDDQVHTLEMFSSMGNGFTFELESLLFYALSCSINYHLGARGKISVYGDDIIVPVAAAPSYDRFFSWFGFKVNSKKSFTKGRFRESCGKHYYAGRDVTPFYIREPIRDQSRLIHALNRFRAWCVQMGALGIADEGWSFWKRWSTYVDFRLHGGYDVDSVAVLVSEKCPRARSRMRLAYAPRGAHRQGVRGRLFDYAPSIGSYLLWHHSREIQELEPRVNPRLSRLDCWYLELAGELWGDSISPELVTSRFYLHTERFVFKKRIDWDKDRPLFLEEI